LCRDHIKAIECYRQFLTVLGATEDKFAQGLAHNSIGVAYQNLGGSYLAKAEYHHSLHSSFADLPGQFIAHTNLGLVYHGMCNSELAMEHHRAALEAATALQSTAGQSIAIGNLGLTGYETRDLSTARAW
jgi:tetratricopeptide (TPR) repeat protein